MKNWNDFSLPLHISNPNEFIKAFETKVDYYYGKFEELLQRNLLSKYNEKLKESLDKIIEYKNKVIGAYYNYIRGKQSEAIKIVENIVYENEQHIVFPLRKSKAFIGNSFYLTGNEENINLYLFRGRLTEPYHEYHAVDLLHVPLNKRELVDTYRFSIPGVPCFYFSANSYVLWNELKKPTLDKLAISCFDLTDLLDKKIIDISFMIDNAYYYLIDDHYRTDFSLKISGIIEQIKLTPLILACSVVCDVSYQRKFKVEYLFPQLLMQLLNEECIGIAYRSNRIENGNILACNLAIPILEFEEEYKYGKIIDKIKVTDSLNIGYFDTFLKKVLTGVFDNDPKGPSSKDFSFFFKPTIGNCYSTFNKSLGDFYGLSYDGRTLYKDMIFWSFDEYLLYKYELKKITNEKV